MPHPDNHEKLEQVVHRTLRELPSRRAPHSLERRVQMEIERRAALPWWRKSFAYWPMTARVGFIVLCSAIVKLAFTASVWVMAGIDAPQFTDAFAGPLAWIENGFVVGRALVDFFDIMVRNIPALWLYAGLVFFAALYAALFGVGAAAFKALRAQQ